jgi:hypothetical protein
VATCSSCWSTHIIIIGVRPDTMSGIASAEANHSEPVVDPDPSWMLSLVVVAWVESSESDNTVEKVTTANTRLVGPWIGK